MFQCRVMLLMMTAPCLVRILRQKATVLGEGALREAGFTDVTFEPVVAEAGIVSGVRPA